MYNLNSPRQILFEGYGGTVKFEQIEVEFSNSGGVDFDTEVEFTNTVSVPSPSNSTDATNKDYVDSVTVPVGGMVACLLQQLCRLDGWIQEILMHPCRIISG